MNVLAKQCARAIKAKDGLVQRSEIELVRLKARGRFLRFLKSHHVPGFGSIICSFPSRSCYILRTQ